MAWTTPKTWVAGNTLTAAELNEQVRDNLDFLYTKPSANYVLDEAADYTTTSTTFVDVDGTNLSLAITTGGGNVLVWFHGFLYSTVNFDIAYFDIDVDGSRIAGDDGMTAVYLSYSSATDPIGAGSGFALGDVSFARLITGLSAGSHTFKLQWKTRYGRSVELFAGAGTSNADMHPQFGVREL